MAGILPSIKRFMENDVDGYGRRCTMEELKSLTPEDRADFKEMLAAVGIDCE